MSLRALLLDREGEDIRASVTPMADADLPKGDLVVDVLYSSLNYKDALAVTGRGKVVRGEYPFVPGIDLVGRILSSESEAYAAGDVVLATGWGLGESRWGGYIGRQRLRSDEVVPLPEGLDPKSAMVAGTAGLTAMLAIMELESRNVTPTSGDLLVTGASGGVGSFAVAWLAALGYRVEASTGSPRAAGYLERLGAHRIVERKELSVGAARPLESVRWAGAVDVVGGKTLAAVLATLDRHGAVAACGLAGGHELHTTVFPFILRGVSLLGIDSNTCPAEVRRAAWQRIAEHMTSELEREVTASTIGLEEIPTFSRHLLEGEIQGRVVVDISKGS